ncbi:MAG: FHA domain-containing protein [Eubacterium sp.]|nr:FHA domain-containing protein [Eubacterium sp.]
MGIIISVYSKNAFREYILPAADNTDHTITIGRRYFSIGNDLKIGMEVLSGEWYIKASDDYSVRGLEAEHGRYRLKTGSIISVTDRDGDDFRLISREVPELYHSLTKLDVSAVDRVMIGRAEDNDICYDSLGLVSKYHAVLLQGKDGWSVRNQSKNGIYVGSQRIMEECRLSYGSLINIFGLHLICLGDVLAVDDPQNGMVLSPSFKRYQSSDQSHVRTEDMLGRNSDGSKHALEADHYSLTGKDDGMTPVDGTTESTASFGEDVDIQRKSTLDYAPVTIEQPVLGVSRWKEVYKEYLDKKEQEIRSLNENNRKAMLAMYPSSLDIMAGNEVNGLWKCGAASDDLLKVRIGTGEIQSINDIFLEEGKLYLTDKELYEQAVSIVEKYRTIPDVAFTVDLDGMNSVCISGEDRDQSMDTAGNIIAQLAWRISPSDLRMAFISCEESEDDASWREARWLPHTWSEDMSCRYYATDMAGAAETVYKLSRVLISREELSDEEIADLPRYIVFVSDLMDINGTLLQNYIMRRRYLGFTIVYISDREKMPASANWILIGETGGAGTVYGSMTTGEQSFRADGFDRESFGRFARRLAAVRNEASDGIAIIPDFVTLFDTLGIGTAEELGIKDRWAKNRTYDHLAGALGKGAGNMVRTLDLHERYHGPHALIAGTTGAGKSELLQSYIASLAAEYSPEDLNFVLVDFKGGGMANTLKGLPHIAGLITNLSGGEIGRAIMAVKNEIVKRQKVLNDYGINHIDDYVRLYKSGEVSEAIPHLVIVVDEFAELKKEKPEFMKDLISVAQTGRSLGIHLVLATQRPRGNVDDDIRSNMRSAVCLRVQDRKDSMDVLDRPDAAYLTGAGRGYLEVGAGELFEPFQAAFSGKSRMSTGRDTGRVLMLTDDGRADVVSAFSGHEEEAEDSQLDMIKAEIIHTAEESGSAAEALWLPELKHVITDGDIEACDRRGQNRLSSFAIGMIDDPENRQQYPLMLDFPGSGNIAIVGTPSSGKTTAVRTLLDRIANTGQGRSGDISVYGIDLDSGMMEEFEDSSFVGRVVTGQDVLGIEELLDDLGEMTERRKAASEETNAGSPCVVLIDSYEDFRNTAGYKCETMLADLMREGPGVGISYVVTGGGFGLGQISGSVERNIRTVLSIQQRNRYEYMDTLHTSGIETIPEEDIKGRGLTVIRGRVLEFQIALTGQADTDAAETGSADWI